MKIEDKSVDSVLLSSPPEDWGRVTEVMKPGAHLLLLSSVKGHHVGTIAAEDSGLEIRDAISYVFADGENDVAMQLITMARKPLEGTVAENVLKWGNGGINVDRCRVGSSKSVPASISKKAHANCYHGGWKGCGEIPGVGGSDPNLGRWPANLLHCGSPIVQSLFPDSKTARIEKPCPNPEITGHKWGSLQGNRGPRGYDGDGSAARFFYSAPCLNDLLAYLLKLVTPKNGTVFTNCNTDNLPEEYNYVTDFGL